MSVRGRGHCFLCALRNEEAKAREMMLEGAFVFMGIAAGAPDTGGRKAMRLPGERAGG